MAVSIVDLLEVIDVQRQQQRGLAGARHSVDLARQRQLEAAPVGQTGERVAAGHVDQRVDQRLQPDGAARRALRQFVARLAQQLQRHFELQVGRRSGGRAGCGTCHRKSLGQGRWGTVGRRV